MLTERNPFRALIRSPFLTQSRSAALIALIAVAAALIGAAQAARASDAPPAPIWSAEGVVEPIGLLRVRTGEEAVVEFRRAAPGGVSRILHVEASSPIVRTVVEGTVLRLEAVETGFTRLAVHGQTPEGVAHMMVPVVVRRDPLVEFAYDPGGRTVSTATVAGEFNGWDSGRNPMERGEDGVFRASLPMAPGAYTYKFVVDGDWIADPSNPVQDTSGFGNSVLVVEGEGLSERTARLAPAAAWESRISVGIVSMRAARREALDDLRIALPEEWRGEGPPIRAIAFANNRYLSEAYASEFPEDGILRIKAPDLEASPSNHATVLLTRGDDEFAVLETRWDAPDAPRSPRDEVVYYAFTDRFHNGDPSNDWRADHPDLHPLVNYHGGDWAGIRERIADGYFERLGVTTLWIAPHNLNTFNVERDARPPHRLFTSYHGYWPVSFTETNPAFGTMEELRGLADDARAAGIALMLDFVANHVHRDHPILAENPGWIVPLEGPDGEPNIRKFDQFPLTTWFDDFLPTLDFDGNDALRAMMAENAAFWLDQTGADAFRFDAVKHVPLDFWVDLQAMLDERYRQGQGRKIYTLGETIAGHGAIAEFVGPGRLDGQFDFALLFALQDVLGRGNGTMRDLAGAIERSRDAYPPASVMSPLLGNHDTPRFAAYADGDLGPGVDEREIGFTNPPEIDHDSTYDRVRAAFALLFALPGPPTLYYGDEIAMTGAQDPDNRRPMVWDGWTGQQQATFDAVAGLAALRHAEPTLRRGRVEVLAADEESLLLARIGPAGTILFAMSRGGGELDAPLPPGWQGVQALEVVKSGGGEMRLGEVGERIAIRSNPNSWAYFRPDFGD